MLKLFFITAATVNLLFYLIKPESIAFLVACNFCLLYCKLLQIQDKLDEK